MAFQHISAVMFDFDDTLQDRDRAFRKYAADFCSRHFPTLSDAETTARVEDMALSIRGGYVEREVFFQSLIEKWDWHSSPSIEELILDYNQIFPTFSTLFDDTRPVLTQLKARGYRLGILTNGVSVLQNRKLDCCGVRALVDESVVSGDIGVHKPDPRVFLYAAERLSLPPERILFVGDHPVNDIRGAKEVGMAVLRLLQGVFAQEDLEGVPTVRTLSELLPLLPDVAE